MMKFVGWLIGALVAAGIVFAIPGDQGMWAALIGFACALTGFTVGAALEG
jgi:uncharacterized membrane protein AbrB (regulator of aidB expression)